MYIRGKCVRNYVGIYEEENMNGITCSSSMWRDISFGL